MKNRRQTKLTRIKGRRNRQGKLKFMPAQEKLDEPETGEKHSRNAGYSGWVLEGGGGGVNADERPERIALKK